MENDELIKLARSVGRRLIRLKDLDGIGCPACFEELITRLDRELKGEATCPVEYW